MQSDFSSGFAEIPQEYYPYYNGVLCSMAELSKQHRSGFFEHGTNHAFNTVIVLEYGHIEAVLEHGAHLLRLSFPHLEQQHTALAEVLGRLRRNR